CAWAEGELGESRQEMRRAQMFLSELHLAAIALPDLGCGEDYEVKCSQKAWSYVVNKFAQLPLSGYWDVFDPLKEEQPVFNSLNDDLADIYRDVKEGLTLFDQQYVVEAVWEWRFNFQIHWGHHLVGAQRALHQFLAGEGL
ncbi:MAG: DUF5063 domain-containing protein, partial [Acidobacteria bacterium]|nr:DUF5063 domain-containing protein [Acidobacteriota bacterium]